MIRLDFLNKNIKFNFLMGQLDEKVSRKTYERRH